jgi:hypothetical protein
MRCSIFNCDKKHMNQCCALCSDLSQCKNPCLNHPDRCGKLRAETPKEKATAAGVHYVSKATANQVLDSGWTTGQYIPLGRFICREGKKFIGIDNSDGDAWTEEFSTEAECVRWLTEDVPREECGP